MKISVIIPIYNAEKYMRRAVESALDQSETAEVLLIEDVSPDNALKICCELQREHEKVKLLQHADLQNHGAGASRNLGINNAKFDYIAFLDADDFYLKDRFAKARALFTEYPDIDGVYEPVGFEFLSDAGRQKWQMKGLKKQVHMVEDAGHDNLFEALVKDGKGTIHLNGLTVKKAIFKKCGYFFESLKVHQDTALIVQMSVCGKLIPGQTEGHVAVRTFHDDNRILNQKDERFNKYLYWRTLFNWAQKYGLSKRRLKILFNRYIHSVFSLLKSEHFRISINYDRVALLLYEFLNHPFLFIGAVSQILSGRFKRRVS
jgi:glycosyltransferase involved in cell wall biosynthesis